DIDLERTKAFDELKGELSDIALDIASQVMEREIRQEDHEAFIDALISNVGDVS
ncbi:MAG TPA: ATP synthase F0 subunit B, partial [Candidatus Ventricola intestinavium]|nr:ATP synthase F0 subunit B [Candidatus Ventricola intestinavium]